MPENFDSHKVLLSAFPGLPENEAHQMASSGQVNTYPAGSVLTHEGAYEYVFYIIMDGEVEVTKNINNEENRVLKHLGCGDFFGEMAIIHNAPRAATIVTVKPTTVLELPKEIFTRMMETSSSMSLAMVREVSRRLRENDEMAIEDLRLKAKELAEAYQQLAEQDFARREFLTTIAHELRTPLMAANGFMQIARTGMLQGEGLKSALETVSRNLQEISALVNDILFLQEMDLILPDFQTTDLGAIVSSSVDQVRSKADLASVSLNLNISPNLPGVAADNRSLTRAISAILDNAIKFSPDGGEVTIEVKKNKEDLQVVVTDRGVGIPASAYPHIFDRFFHLDQVGGRLFRGVGLGLSIARQVIELHHGAIEVESTLGQGSKFTILLPAA